MTTEQMRVEKLEKQLANLMTYPDIVTLNNLRVDVWQLAERAEKAEAEAAAMRECLSLLPSGPCGGKMERADYYACVGGDVLLKCMQTLVSGTAGRDILERLKAAEEKADRIERAAERAVAERNGCIESLEAFLAASQQEVERLQTVFSDYIDARTIRCESPAPEVVKPFPRYFRTKDGFKDGTDYVRFDSAADRSMCVKNGRDFCCGSWKFTDCLSWVADGTVEEIPDPRPAAPDRTAELVQLVCDIESEITAKTAAYDALLTSEKANTAARLKAEQRVAELEAERKWVPVGKRLPGMDGKYLVCEGDRVESATFVSRERWPWEWGDGTTSDPEAWQPLPPAPEKEEA